MTAESAAEGGAARRENRSTVTPTLGALVTAVAAVLAFYRLGSKQFRLDEATSWFIAQLDWARLWDALATSEANAGIYYALLRLWLPVGESEAALRALSVLFGVATVPIVYALGVRLFGRVPATVAALLLGVNAFFVENLQDARGYALATFLITAASLLFVDVLWRPARWRTVAYVAVAAIAAYAHFFSALIVLAHLVSAVAAGPRPLPVKRLAIAFVAIGALIAPLIGFSLANDVGQIDWIPDPTLARFGDGWVDLTGNSGAVLAIGYALALVATGAVLARKRARGSFERWRYAFVLAWVVLPVVIVCAASFVKPIFVPRYLMGTMPALALVAAAALALLRGRLIAIGIAVVAGALVLSAGALSAWYEEPGDPWRTYVDRIVESTRPGDGMVFYSPTALRLYLYHAHRMDVVDDLPALEYPSSYGWLGFSRTRYHPNYDAIAERSLAHDRMWLIEGVTWDEPRQEEFRRLFDTLRERCSGVELEYGPPRKQVFLFGPCSVSLRFGQLPLAIGAVPK